MPATETHTSLPGPWVPFSPTSSTTTTNSPAWHQKLKIPYTTPSNPLQTLDLYIPSHHPQAPASSSSTTSSSSHSSSHQIWLIYIHGGAWRDPLVTSAAILPSLHHLLPNPHHASTVSHIAGIASLNYSLSPHPNYPRGSIPDDDDVNGSGRTAVHPQHIEDVRTALKWLHGEFTIEHYILIGHSCGATLALQTIMPQSWASHGDSTLSPPQPIAIGGLAGLYDLPSLVSDPGPNHAPYAAIYKQFLIGAFGEDVEVWKRVSPTWTLDTSRSAWKAGVLVVLGASEGDTLVPMNQWTGLGQRLTGKSTSRGQEEEEEEGDIVECRMVAVGGDHDEMWREGRILAEFMVQVLEGTITKMKAREPGEVVV